MNDHERPGPAGPGAVAGRGMMGFPRHGQPFWTVKKYTSTNITLLPSLEQGVKNLNHFYWIEHSGVSGAIFQTESRCTSRGKTGSGNPLQCTRE